MTQLDLYNGALLHCGERFIASLTENREPRRLLDHVWATGGVNACLEKGQWNFAMKTIQIDYDPSIQPDFGYNRAFQKPTDWILTSSVCSDEYFREPNIRHVDETGFWYADLDTLYVRYVSNDVSYGGNLNSWPDSFRAYVEAYFAYRIIGRLTNSESETARLSKMEKDMLKTAKSRAAMAEPTSFPARGSWTKSRNRQSSRNDGGNSSGALIG